MIACPHAVSRPLPPRGLDIIDDEPGGGLHLGLVEEVLAVLGERAAVDVEQHGVLAPGLEALRAHDPGVDLAGAVGRRHGELLPPEEAAGDPRHRTVERDDLGRVLDGRLGHGDAPGRGVEGVHGERPAGERLGRRRSVDGEPEEVRVAAVLGGGQHGVVVEPHRGAAPAGRAERAVEAGGDPAVPTAARRRSRRSWRSAGR